MNLKFKRGFTLIELLVVIAIIGILSGIVLTSLGTARTKAKDAAAKGALAGLRAEMEIYADTNTNYGTAGKGTVTSGGTASGLTGGCNATQALAILKNVAGNAGSTATCTVGVSGNSWVAWVMGAGQTSPENICADSSGFSGERAAAATDAATAAVNCAAS